MHHKDILRHCQVTAAAAAAEGAVSQLSTPICIGHPRGVIRREQMKEV